MIFTNISEIKPYIPTTQLDISYLEKHETRAILKHLPKYLGTTLTKALLVEAPSAANLLLIEKLKGAIANLSYLEAIPFIDLVSTKTGFGVVSTQNIAPASAHRVNNFTNAALKAAEDYISDALLFLELNANDYTDWNKSSMIEGGIIESIDEWPLEIDINYSRVAFVNLAPFIRKAERVWLIKKISAEFVASIAGTEDMNVLPDLQKALAFMSYSLKDPSGLEEDTANEYLNSAIDYLNNHLTDYPVYAEFGFNEPFQNNLEDYGFLKMG